MLGNSVWQLISQSDKITWFVLSSLLILTIICWSLFFYKIFTWKNKKKQINNAISNLKNVQNFENLIFISSNFNHTLPGFFLSKNLVFLKNLTNDGKAKVLSDREWNFFQYNLDASVEEIMHKEDSMLPIFSVTAAVSPLLGLFGTVWGLVHAFIDISRKQSADITTVAPGIAEALITTLAGLMVAIPSLAMYYYLKMNSEKIEQSLFSLSDKILLISQNIFFKIPMEINQCVYAEEKAGDSLRK